MYTNEGERNGSRDTNIFILVTSILLQKLFPRRDKRGGEGERPVGIQRVSRRTKS